MQFQTIFRQRNIPLGIEYTSYVAHNIFKVNTTSPNPSKNMTVRPHPLPLGHLPQQQNIYIFCKIKYMYVFICM